MTPNATHYPRDGIEFARALTFFDAIYAFALTLLITSVNDFSPAGWQSLPALWEANGSALTSFAISFLVVVQFWRASHHAVSTLRYLDARLIALQTLAVFGVILIPFSTEAMGKPALRGLPLPVAFYAVNVAAAYLVQILFAVVADRSGATGSPPMTTCQPRQTLAGPLTVPLIFLASIPVAYLSSPAAAQRTWLILLLLTPLLGRLRNRGRHRP